MIDPVALRAEFVARVGREPRLFRAPGRVNLIGEHTDYNDGFVLPMAIERETVVAAAARDDRVVRVTSRDMDETVAFDLDGAPGPTRRGVWLDYVEGVARSLEARGVRLRGADCLLASDVPVGAGLSSSAALEISIGLALASVAGRGDVDRVALALAGQAAEHDYVGANVGIMDQFVAALGRAGCALLVDCRSLRATPVPLDLPDTVVAVCDSRVKHDLAASAYNARRAECERGVALLAEALPGVTALRDVTIEALERNRARLPEVVYRRCRHVVGENARTLEAADAMRSGDAGRVGRLMLESHASLRDDYEVSCPELDALVRIAASVDGVAGSRMTGGGFGGCTVSLVRRDALDRFRHAVRGEYARLFGIEPPVYVTGAADGASEIAP